MQYNPPAYSRMELETIEIFDVAMFSKFSYNCNQHLTRPTEGGVSTINLTVIKNRRCEFGRNLNKVLRASEALTSKSIFIKQPQDCLRTSGKSIHGSSETESIKPGRSLRTQR
jgi:hypothetical protein